MRSHRGVDRAQRAPAGRLTWAICGLGVVLVVVVLALSVPGIVGRDVHADGFAPISADLRPRFGPGTLPALVIGALAAAYGSRLSMTTRWPVLLPATFVVGAAWMIALATVDGRAGLADILQSHDEYLRTARAVHDVPQLLRHFTDGIPDTSAVRWPTHVAGHPPAALLLFVVLVHLHLGGGLAAALVVVALAATVPAAVLITVCRLDGELTARRAAPFLAIGPAAIWLAVSADAVFTAATAWGLCLLALSATAGGAARVAFGIGAGVVLGLLPFLSYGLVLVGVLAAGVLVCARTARPLITAIPAAVAVAGVFAGYGFLWWQAYPLLRERYYAGVASIRPAGYWLWADLAALSFAAGPAIGPSVALALRTVRARRSVAVLTTSALACIALADVSLMSKAETERIWLPFVPWLLVAVVLLPARWRRRLFVAQVVVALVVETVFRSRW